MKGRADLVFELDNVEEVYQALAPEAEEQIHRSVICLDKCSEGIRLKIESEDLVSLRAALNTWIRLIKIAWEMVKA